MPWNPARQIAFGAPCDTRKARILGYGGAQHPNMGPHCARCPIIWLAVWTSSSIVKYSHFRAVRPVGEGNWTPEHRSRRQGSRRLEGDVTALVPGGQDSGCRARSEWLANIHARGPSAGQKGSGNRKMTGTRGYGRAKAKKPRFLAV